MTERLECGEGYPGGEHTHRCWRGVRDESGHYDDHLCECGFDWPRGAERHYAHGFADGRRADGMDKPMTAR